MKRKQNLENSIIHITCMLNKLKTLTEESEDYNMAYNRLLVQRAELRKNLSDIQTNNIINLFNNNLKKINCLKPKNREKLISDYFK